MKMKMKRKLNGKVLGTLILMAMLFSFAPVMSTHAEITGGWTTEEKQEIAEEHGFATWAEYLATCPAIDFSSDQVFTNTGVSDCISWLALKWDAGEITTAQYVAIVDNLSNGVYTPAEIYADPIACATTKTASVTGTGITVTETPVTTTKVATEKITIKPTCTMEGELTKTSAKGVVTTEVIPAMGHDYEIFVETEPTCTEDGLYQYKCMVCGDVKDEIIPATGHTYGEPEVTEATCTENGFRKYTCETCGEVKTEIIQETGHTESDWVITKEATLLTNGEQVKTCTVCGEILKTEEIPSDIPLWVTITSILVLLSVLSVATVIIVKKRKGSSMNISSEDDV